MHLTAVNSSQISFRAAIDGLYSAKLGTVAPNAKSSEQQEHD
jgi:hypothetical protein